MQIVPLSPEEKDKIRQENLQGGVVTVIAFAVIGTIAFFILSSLDKDAFFIVYVVAFVFILVVLLVAYQFYLSWQDLRIGTKTVFQDKIAEKKHSITHSSSGSGSTRTTTTKHHYTFILEQNDRLTVEEKHYRVFTQGQTVQIEKLAYSQNLWNISLVQDAPSDLPADSASSPTLPTPESIMLALDNAEINHLESRLTTKIFWALLSVLPYAFVLYLAVMVVNGLLGFFPHDSNDWIYNALIALALAGALVWRSIRNLQKKYVRDIEAGKELTCLRLADKDLLQSGGTECILYFENTLCVPVKPDIFQELEVNHHYWVGKACASQHLLTLQTQDRQKTWNLF